MDFNSNNKEKKEMNYKKLFKEIVGVIVIILLFKAGVNYVNSDVFIAKNFYFEEVDNFREVSMKTLLSEFDDKSWRNDYNSENVVVFEGVKGGNKVSIAWKLNNDKTNMAFESFTLNNTKLNELAYNSFIVSLRGGNTITASLKGKELLSDTTNLLNDILGTGSNNNPPTQEKPEGNNQDVNEDKPVVEPTYGITDDEFIEIFGDVTLYKNIKVNKVLNGTYFDDPKWVDVIVDLDSNVHFLSFEGMRARNTYRFEFACSSKNIESPLNIDRVTIYDSGNNNILLEDFIKSLDL